MLRSNPTYPSSLADSVWCCLSNLVAGSLVLACLVHTAWASEPTPEDSARPPVQPDISLRFEPRRTGSAILSRIRASTGVELLPWLRVRLVAQDAHAAGWGRGFDRASLADGADLHELFVEAGNDTAWMLRAGRQELSFGDERLIGSDSEWSTLGQRFDGVHFRGALGKREIEAFWAMPVRRRYNALDHYEASTRLQGLRLSLAREARSSFEVYAIGKQERDSDRTVTLGFRATGALARSLDYNLETAIQRGGGSESIVRAWAQHWEVGWRPGALRLAAEYNYASGDRDPQDGRRTTFDDLYPAAYNKHGFEDPFAWRNLHGAGLWLDYTLGKNWALGASYRRFWAASRQDGVYAGGEASPSTSSEARLADHTALFLARSLSARSKLCFGWAYLMPGPYLKSATVRLPHHSPFLSWRYAF
jgi:hypothetical protein